MLATRRSGPARLQSLFHPAISISNDGLVCGAGSILVRMAGVGGSSPRLRVEDDAARLIAMLSVAFNRRVSAAEIIPSVRAAAEHWARGDKAVANFRLSFARLPPLRDTADADRMRLAEYLLDRGFSPDSLMEELGFGAHSIDLEKYREDQPRVPAGFGIESGRWTSDTSFDPSVDRRTRVAEELPEEDEKDYETRRLEGRTSRQEDLEHGRSEPLRLPELPAGIGPGPFAGKPIPAGPGPRANPAQQREVDVEFKKNGCHTCGTSDPGTGSGRAIADHQKPTALIKPGEQQFYYPQCIRCSRSQGGRVRAFKYRGD